jgi:tetratricopeptide (TPR) repeat protein
MSRREWGKWRHPLPLFQLGQESPGHRSNPKCSVFYGNRGNCLRLQGRYDLALQDCIQAVQLDEKNAHAYLVQGMTLEKMGRLAQAQDDYEKAVLLQSEYAKSAPLHTGAICGLRTRPVRS